MDLREQEELENAIRIRCNRRDWADAVTVALRGYGPQIFGLLMALHRSEQDTTEVFSMFTEDAWIGLAQFAWACSFRTWAYTLARNASYRFKKHAGRDAARMVPMSACSTLPEIQEQVRTETLPYLRTQTKTKMAALRDTLPEEDQWLLILRLDRRLAWNDLARVMLEEGDQPLADDKLKKEAARLRKRFQFLKARLIELGKQEGLFEAP
jgi:RNA polymerase sigma-70 factor (ECF subfamily)